MGQNKTISETRAKTVPKQNSPRASRVEQMGAGYYPLRVGMARLLQIQCNGWPMKIQPGYSAYLRRISFNFRSRFSCE